MKKIILFLSTILLLLGCSNSYKSVNYIDAVDLIENKHAVLIDVRTLIEYNEKHIESAINMPNENIEVIEDIIIDKNTYIIVYCRSGKRSKESYDKLKSLGYKNVYDLGSIDNWEGKYESEL